MADEQRIEVLEQHVRALYEQIGALREELKGHRSAARPPQPTAAEAAIDLVDARRAAPESPPMAAHGPENTPAPEPVAAPRHVRTRKFASAYGAESAPSPGYRPDFGPPLEPEMDVEKLLGRYGTLAVASLAILMGVGTFLSWAIEHGYLGPTVRVILGFIGAGVVAAVGLWVREKRDVRFGNVLLALSLAIVHVDAWAAGPYLHVLSTVAAFAIAAGASAALAALALTSDEMTLFSVGFVGALLAPFFTASEPGSTIVLLTYGWVVIALSLFAIREKGWEPIRWLTLIGATFYVFAANAAGPVASTGQLTALAPVIFAFACVGAALLFARHALRAKLALSFLVLTCLATVGYSTHAQSLEVIISILGTAASYLIVREMEIDDPWIALGNIILPLCFLFATIASAHDREIRALAAGALTVIAGLLAWEDEEERSQHLLVCAIASGMAIVAYLVDFDTRCIGALALHAALFTMVFRSTRARVLVAPIAIGLLIASAWSLVILQARVPFSYTPFLTIPSLCTLASVSGWTFLATSLRPGVDDTNLEDKPLVALFGGIAIVVAFCWIRQEIVDAYSADVSSFALIIYYAIAGLALIFAGRWRHIGIWRGAGLALAFYAGWKALAQTFTIDAIGMRVGARILVGVFLASVAYWYRAPSSPAPADPAPAGDASANPVGTMVSE